MLRRAILSALNQTHSSVRVFVSDDASDDETSEVVRTLMGADSRISYFCHPENVGVLSNLKYIFSCITTPFFSILSDDDILDRQFYEHAMGVFKQYPEVKFVILDSLTIDKNTNLRDEKLPTGSLRLYLDDSRMHAFLKGEVPSDWTAMVFRKEVANVYLEMQDKYDIASDMRFLLIAVSRHKFAYLSKIGAYFSFHPDSYSVNRQFDYFHRITQLSRFVEVFHDSMVSTEIKNTIIGIIRKRVSLMNHYEPMLKRAIKYHCGDLKYVDIATEINERKKFGMKFTVFIMQILFRNKMIGIIINFIFKKYYYHRSVAFSKRVLALQNGFYKSQFEYLKSME